MLLEEQFCVMLIVHSRYKISHSIRLGIDFPEHWCETLGTNIIQDFSQQFLHLGNFGFLMEKTIHHLITV